jgi:YggT family protein
LHASAFSAATNSVSVVNRLVGFITLGLIVWIILSYIVVFGRVSYDHPVRRLYEFINRLVEPMLRPIRAVVPPVRMGGASLDLSPVILIIGIQLIPVVLGWFF